MKFVVEGRIQTGSYTNKDGVKIVVENVEFAESKKMGKSAPDGFADFMNIPDGMEEEMPF